MNMQQQCLLIAVWILVSYFGIEAVRAIRVQTTGDECVLPMEVNARLYDDCIVLQGVEWCLNANGGWGICKACVDCEGIPLNVPEVTDSLTPATPSDQPKLENEEQGFQIGGQGSDVVINEVMVNDPMGSKDWIELYNKGTEPVNLTGWLITDSRSSEEQNPLVIGEGVCGRPEVTIIHPGGFLKFTKGAQCGFDFGLGEEDQISLFQVGANETSVDFIRWGPEEVLGGATFARYQDGSDTLVYGRPTPGMPNEPASTSYLGQLKSQWKVFYESCTIIRRDIKFKWQEFGDFVIIVGFIIEIHMPQEQISCMRGETSKIQIVFIHIQLSSCKLCS
eukprot:TRINITY_DN5155_c0_g1_i4.p1 TRINITY_DN5155_c0_g1~~TRINITY_DN5155_c0_g1_i4.p1  ORF type:complete len:335 (-),score=33.03 TRINITY_DN5155_c0_g1_i4:506-1510(-)